MDLESWQDLPLETMLKEAADPLSREDTRLPTAFALLDRLKVYMMRQFCEIHEDVCSVE